MKNLFSSLDNYNKFIDNEVIKDDDRYDEISKAIASKAPKEYISFIGGVVFCLGLGLIIFGPDKVSGDTALLFYILGGILILIGAFLCIYYYVKEYQFRHSKEVKSLRDEIDEICDNNLKNMDLEAETTGIDIITTDIDNVMMKNKPIDVSLQKMETYNDHENLCIYYGLYLVKIPLRNLNVIEEVKTEIRFKYWMQEEKRDSDKYAKYIEKYNKHYTVLKSYCKIVIDDDANRYQIILPNYEMQKINRIISLYK